MKTSRSVLFIVLFSTVFILSSCHGSGTADSENDSTMVAPAPDNTGRGINGGPNKDSKNDAYDTGGRVTVDTTANGGAK